MARSFLTPINLNKLELQNAAIQNLGTAPASPVKGQLYYNSTGGDDTLYWWNGTTWVAAKAAAGAIPATTVTTQAVGDAAVVGVATTFAREDHKHGREAFGASTAVTTFGAAKADGTAVTVSHSDHTHGSPTHDATAHSTIPISALAGAAAAIDMNGFVISEVGTPIAATDAANKGYVDNAIAGLSWKEAVRLGSTGNVALTALTAIDGVTPVAGDRILLKNQTAPAENGIWVAAAAAWTRATDADSGVELNGAAVYVEEGTTNQDTAWSLSTNLPITVGTTALSWVQFAGGGTVTAGAGMTQSGNTLNVIAGDATLTVAADSIVRAALTGDVTTVVNVATIATAAVTNAKMANMPANTIKGNNTAGSAVPLDLSVGQLSNMLGSLVARKQFQGCSAGLSSVIAHSFASRNFSVTVYRAASPYDEVECDVEHTDNTTVTITFAAAVAANEYTIVMIG